MILETYLTLAVQSTIVLSSASLACALLRRASASLRHAVWAAAFCLLLLLPVVPQPGWLGYTHAVEIPASLQLAGSRTSITVRGEAPAQAYWPVLLVMVHLSGAALLLGRSLWARVRLEDQAEAQSLEVPVVMGLWKPRIYLPTAATTWTEEKRRVALAHEEEHIRRLDLWWQMAALVGTALYWPHPLAWWAKKQLLEECEQACDDGVIAKGVAPSRYAEHLVEIARSVSGARQQRLEGGLAMARPQTLQQRIRTLLDPLRSHQGLTKRTVGLVVLCALALLAPVAGYRVMAQSTTGLSGVVKDASGSVIPWARVSLSLGERREITRTNSAGEFYFPGLPAGNWKVQVQKDGFALMEMTGLAVLPNTGTRFDPVLYAGSLSESVKVVGRDGSLPPPPPPPPAPAGFTPSPIRVGGNVQAAKIITRVPPLYPADCKAEGIQGTVLLKAVVGKDGSVVSLTPLNKLVDERLVKAATESVQQWKYQTTLLNGQPVEVMTEVEVNFTLMP
ncbi:MAG: M56 family metallopeptidase [Bryobacter sp.]|nr:M56 family metallopeptidase [Bryobacter sp.]